MSNVVNKYNTQLQGKTQKKQLNNFFILTDFSDKKNNFAFEKWEILLLRLF